MKIGIPHIDLQHSAMIDFANKVACLCVNHSSGEEVKKCLDFLGEYVVRHFNDEEKLQIESNYPRYKQHKEIHREFTETFKSLYAEFERSGASDEFASAMSNRVFNWIITHVKKEDVMFGKHYMKVKSDRMNTSF